ncbi:MAG: hypothetical protein M2R45_03873 [Verrucomicrobia subdivision 3 bacterium]|nr:hypothetical protein [Limisphaerales bacterium]MCS1412577.1 hypothetical protein [Limisphaerales bacterium]
MDPKTELFTGYSRGYPFKPAVQERAGQWIKLTMVALLTALALPSAALAQPREAVSNHRSNQGIFSLDRNTWAATTSFTVGPLPADAATDAWELVKVRAWFNRTEGNPPPIVAGIYSEDSRGERKELAFLRFLKDGRTVPIEIRDRGWYDFYPESSAGLGSGAGTLRLEPGETYWLQYSSPSAEHLSVRYRISNTLDGTERGLDGWSIGNIRKGAGRTSNRPLQFSVTVLPEPSEYALFFALGLGAFAIWHRRRQRGQQAAA